MQERNCLFSTPTRAALLAVLVGTGASCRDKPAGPSTPPAPSSAPSATSTALASARVDVDAAASPASDPTHLRDVKLWAHRLGSTSLDESVGLVVDRDGSIIVAGKFNGTVDFGGGPKTSAGNADVYLVKLDARGNHVWSRTFGGSDEDEARSLALDRAGNVVLAGEFYGTIDSGSGPLESHGLTDAFVVSFDPSGAPRWGKALGGRGYDTSLGVAADGQNNVLVTGNFKAKADFGGEPLSPAGYVDAFLVKLGPDGTHLWSRSLSGGREAHGWLVSADRQGNVFMAGDFRGTIAAGEEKLKSQGDDIFLAKYDGTGTQLWIKRCGGPVADHGTALAVDALDNLVLLGTFGKDIDLGGGPLPTAGGYADAFVAKLDNSGNHIWSHSYGGPANDSANAVVIDPHGNVAVIGSFAKGARFGGEPPPCAGGSDAFVLLLAPDGTPRWTRTLGGPGDDSGSAIGVDAAGALTVTGYFAGTADFGTGALRSAGNQDVFVVRLPPQ